MVSVSTKSDNILLVNSKCCLKLSSEKTFDAGNADKVKI